MNKVDAVNRMLTLCGVNPMPSLDTGGASWAGRAEEILDEISAGVQLRNGEGWMFNRDVDVILSPDSETSKIAKPAGALSVDARLGYRPRIVSIRGDWLYNHDDNTDTFDGDIHVNVVYQRDFGDIPGVVADYITVEAAVALNARFIRNIDAQQNLAYQRDRTIRNAVDADQRLHNESVFDTISHQMLASGGRRYAGRYY